MGKKDSIKCYDKSTLTNIAEFNFDKGINTANAFKYAQFLMTIFGANTNLARSIPDFRDGLKPVERRILYTMFNDEKLRPKNGRVKVSAIVGTCMNKYHPHGDLSILDVVVRLGQWWQSTFMLVDRQGNYGTIFGDSHAAARYIEAGMTQFCYDCYFKDWFDNIVDMKSNYTEKTSEPEYLSSRYPVILFKGVIGMGYGLSTGIPTYNFGEVIDLTLRVLKSPMSVKDCILIPDSPTGCEIVDTDFKSICEKGEGKFRMRASIDILENGNLKVRNIPYQVKSDKIIEQVVTLVNEKKIDGVKDIIDNSKDKKGVTKIDIEFELKKGFNPILMKELLYKKTMLENSYSVNYEVLYDYQNLHYNLKSLILDWIEFRRETKRRFYGFKYSRIMKRIHTLEALINIISKGTDKLLKLIKKCKSKKDVMEVLIKNYCITDVQADSISEMKTWQYTEEHLKKFIQEKKELEKESNEIEALLIDQKLIDKEIRDELLEGKRKYAIPRKSKVISVNDVKFIPNTNHNIVITEFGLIKKLDNNQEGVGALSPGDKVVQHININNRESLLLFDSKGKVYKLNISDIITTDINKPGDMLDTYVKHKGKIVSIIKNIEKEELEKEPKPIYLVFITKNGMVKKSLFKNYSKISTSGIIGTNIKRDDKLIDIFKMKGDSDLIIYTKNGKGIKYNSSEITETLRNSSGVLGIKLEKGDEVLGISKVKKSSKYFMVITNKGNCKKCPLKYFENKDRASKGSNLISLENNENIVTLISCKDKDVIEINTNIKKQVINISDIHELTRMSKAKKEIPIKKGENIISVNIQ